MKRAFEMNLSLGGTPGPLNHICDIGGITIGHEQIIGKAPRPGPGIATGVSVIFPRPKNSSSFQVPAGASVFNGNGEMTGLSFIDEKGSLEGPIALTGTFSVGTVSQATRKWMRKNYPQLEHKDVFMGLPVVAETYDGMLHAIDEDAVTEEVVFRALENASEKNSAEGDIGGGTGMMSFGFKSGIGSASRMVDCLGNKFLLGALVQSNFGAREDFRLGGRALGEEWSRSHLASFKKDKDGSLIVILATDAPLSPRQLKRVAKRASLGMAELGAMGRHSSGDFFLAFSTISPRVTATGWEQWECPPDSELDAFFVAAKQATHEAILNALLASQAMTSGDRSIRCIRDTGFFK